MSIDLFCYATSSAEETNAVLTRLVAQHNDLFPAAMTVPKARSAPSVSREIATEHGLNAASMFLTSVNDKTQAWRLPEVASLLHQAFDDELAGRRVLILRDNEKPV